MRISMKDLRKGESIMLPFVVVDACDEDGVIKLKIDDKEIQGEKSGSFEMQAPDLSVQFYRWIINQGDIVRWQSHGKLSNGWGRVVGIHESWLIVNLFDVRGSDTPILVLEANCTRDPELTNDRNDLYAQAEVQRALDEKA